jgi:hypothetical protein
MAEGRTANNPGNVNNSLQDYSTSIEYFDKVNRMYDYQNIYVWLYSV